MRAVFVASVITAETTSTFRPEIKISEWAGVGKIRLAFLSKIHRGVEMDPQD